MNATAPSAPSRATASGVLAYGPLTIPVNFYAGVEESGIKREEWTDVTGTYTKVGRVPAVKNDDGTYGPVISYDQIVKRYATASGELVDLSDAEIQEALNLPSGLAQIVAFQPLSMLDAGSYLPDGVMQLRAKNPRGSEAPDYALALLFKAMRSESVFALVKYTMRGSMRYGALIPNGRFLSLRFDDEIREPRPMPRCTAPQQEIDMAVSLVRAGSREGRIGLINDSVEAVRDYAEAKATGDAPAFAVHPVHAPSSVMAMLTEAVEAAMAPASSPASA